MQTFVDRLPHRPYCTDALDCGLQIRNAKTAIKKRYIQHNPPHLLAWMTFDVDRPGAALDWQDEVLPAPAWVAENRANGHAHLSWGIAAPVLRCETARMKPLKYAALIEEGYRRVLGADQGYSGLITKNPLSTSWRVWMPSGDEGGVYDLNYLADWVDLPRHLPRRKDASGLGRNVDLFDGLRVWAYAHVDDFREHGEVGWAAWMRAVHAKAEELNIFCPPLPLAEIRATARSVSKWTWERYIGKSEIKRSFARRQSGRGKRSGRARLRAAALKASR